VCEITDRYFLKGNFAVEITKRVTVTRLVEEWELLGCILCPIEEVFLVSEDHAFAFGCAFAVYIDAVVVATIGIVALHPVMLHAYLHCAYLFEARGE
jgi:hypothetical protein